MQVLCQRQKDADVKTVSLPTVGDQPLTQLDCAYTDVDPPKRAAMQAGILMKLIFKNIHWEKTCFCLFTVAYSFCSFSKLKIIKNRYKNRAIQS